MTRTGQSGLVRHVVTTRMPTNGARTIETSPAIRDIATQTRESETPPTCSLGQRTSIERARNSHDNALDQHPEVCGSMVRDQLHFESIKAAIRELRAGRMIVVVDDEDRENEGDLTIAAELITPEAVNFMATHGRGLICLAMTADRLDQLELGPMVRDNTALGGTEFTVSIDAKVRDVTTGVSAHDRAQTIKAAIDISSSTEDFARPGHVFPLRSRAGGVLERRGHTEAAVDLARLAGLYPAGVICEILNDDGTMARAPDLVRFCKMHDLLIIRVADLERYRLELDYEGSFGTIDGFFPLFPERSATGPSQVLVGNEAFAVNSGYLQ